MNKITENEFKTLNTTLHEMLCDYAKDPKEGKKYSILCLLRISPVFTDYLPYDKAVEIKGKRYYPVYSKPSFDEFVNFEYELRNIYDVIDFVKYFNKTDKEFSFEGIVVDPDTAKLTYDLKGITTQKNHSISSAYLDSYSWLYERKIEKFNTVVERALSQYGNKVIDPVEMSDDKLINLETKPGEFVVVGGRPSMGKTLFAINMMLNEVCVNNGSALFLSLELPSEQLAKRIMSVMANVRVPYRNKTNDETYTKMYVASKSLSKRKIHILDCAQMNIDEIIFKVNEKINEIKPTMIILDYFQLVHYKKDFPKDEKESSTIANKLKKLAKDIGSTVIVTTQLSRNLEYRKNKRPRLSDIRQAKGLDKIADRVLMLYRDAYYHYDCEVDSDYSDLEVIDLTNKKTTIFKFKRDTGNIE